MKINSNIQALIANSVLKTNEGKFGASTERLSSGYKINHAADSPAGMAITNKMNAQIKSLNKAKDNTSNAINVVQTADGALSEVHNMLQRMNELAIKASNGTMTSADRQAIQEEIDALSKEINRVASDTEYNTQNLLGGMQEMKGYTDVEGVKVLDYSEDFPKGDYQITITGGKSAEIKFNDPDKGLVDVANLKEVKVEPEYDEDEKIIGGKVTATLKDGTSINFAFDEKTTDTVANVDVTGIGGMKIQVGTSAGKEIRLVIPKMDTVNMGIDKISMKDQESAQASIEKINKAIDYVSKGRSQLGAYQNRLESTVASLAENIEDLTESYSTIKDVDMAEEMVEYTKLQVLVQAGTSMLTQANEQPQQALQLLQ